MEKIAHAIQGACHRGFVAHVPCCDFDIETIDVGAIGSGPHQNFYAKAACLGSAGNRSSNKAGCAGYKNAVGHAISMAQNPNATPTKVLPILSSFPEPARKRASDYFNSALCQ